MDEGQDQEPQVPPGQRHIIRRPRLERLLDESKARVIMLVAPAGYGKTTLARQWLEQQPSPAVWYQSSESARDVAVLAAGLAAAAEGQSSQAQHRVAAHLRAGPPPDAERLAALLANDFGRWPRDTWLIIDDYHLAASPDVDALVASLAAADAVRILLISRRRPTWASARRILYGEIYEVGTSLLAMNVEEATEVLTMRSASELPGLVALADGWPVVIGLAALTGSRFDTPELAPTLFEYLADELYSLATPEAKRGLMTLSLAPKITATVARSLLGETQAADVLTVGSMLGFFVPQARDVFDLHPLMRTFLQEKARMDAPLLERTVSQLLELLCGAREWDDAYFLASAFSSYERAADVLSDALDELLWAGRVSTVADWTLEIRNAGIALPLLDLADAEVAFRHAAYGEAEALALRAVSQMETSDSELFRAHVLAGRSAHLDSGVERAQGHFSRARAAARTNDQRWRAIWGEFTSAVEHDDLEASLLAEELAEFSDGAPESALRLAAARMMLASFRGGLAGQLPQAKACLPLVAQVRDPFVRTSFLNSLAHALVFNARYQEALPVVAREAEDAQAHSLDFVLPHALIVKAVASLGLRRFDEAAVALDFADSHAAGDDLHIAVNSLVTRARLALATGDTERALSFLTQGGPSMPASHMHGEYLATRALVLASSGRRSGVEDACREAAEVSRDGLTTTLRLLATAIHDLVMGRPDQVAFGELIRLGHLDSIVTAYRAYPPLIERMLASGEMRRELQTLFVRANDARLANKFGVRIVSAKSVHPAELLSPREQEVHGLLALGLTNREIATRLFISESTAKVHVRHILEKFGARSRTQAALMNSRGELRYTATAAPDAE